MVILINLVKNVAKYTNAGNIDIGYKLQSNSTKTVELIETTNRAEKSEMQARDILQTAMDGFWLIDLEGHFLDVNEVACKLSGYTREEMLQMKVGDIDQIESHLDVKSRINKIKNNGQDRFESKHCCKNGKIIAVEISIILQKDKKKLVCFVHDITNRKRTEEELI